MKFNVEPVTHHNSVKYDHDDFELAKLFAGKIKVELGELCKGVCLFGSAARAKGASDIDILVIVNDLLVVLSPEVVESYRVITENVAASVSKRLHITSMKITNFWDYIRNGDPLVMNILRDAVPLYDVGIFEPLQALLSQGRIRPTRESVWNYFARAPLTLRNADWHIMQGCIDLYWAVIDSAHAALMHLGEVPPSPEHAADLMRHVLVKRGIVPMHYVHVMETFYKLQKGINNRQIQRVSGDDFEKYKNAAEDFVARMQKVVDVK